MFHAAFGTGQYRAVLSMTGCSLTGPLLLAVGVLRGGSDRNPRGSFHSRLEHLHAFRWRVGPQKHVDAFQIGSDQLNQTFSVLQIRYSF